MASGVSVIFLSRERAPSRSMMVSASSFVRVIVSGGVVVPLVVLVVDVGGAVALVAGVELVLRKLVGISTP